METSFQPYEGAEPYIFISYARKNSEQALPFLETLNRAGYRVWYDKGIKGSEYFAESIANHISGCEIFLPLLSRAFDKSEYCYLEISRAFGKKKKFFPVYLEDFKMSDRLEFFLNPIQHRKLSEYNGDLEKFVESLKSESVFARCNRFESFDVALSRMLSDLWDAMVSNKKELMWGGLFLLAICFSYGVTLAMPYISAYFQNHWNEILQSIFQLFIQGLLLMTVAIAIFALIAILIYIIFYHIPKQKSSREFSCSQSEIGSIFTVPENYIRIADGNFSGCMDLTRVTLPDSIIALGDATFKNCYNLTDISIPNGVKKIGKQTFYACVSLTSITIPESVTKIDDSAFAFCKSLKSVNIPDSVQEIKDNAFSHCPNLINVSVPEKTRVSPSAFDTPIIRR